MQESGCRDTLYDFALEARREAVLSLNGFAQERLVRPFIVRHAALTLLIQMLNPMAPVNAELKILNSCRRPRDMIHLANNVDIVATI